MSVQPRVPTHPRLGATSVANDSITRRLNSTPSWLGIVSIERVGRPDGCVIQQLLDQHVGFGGVGLAEGRPHAVDDADLVAVLPAAEVQVVLSRDQREDRAAHRHARLAGVPGLAPRRAERVDLLRLQLVERQAAVLGQERRRHQVDADASRPFGGVAIAGAPPDAGSQPGRVRLDALHPGGAGAEGDARIALGETFALDRPQEAGRSARGRCRRRAGPADPV